MGELDVVKAIKVIDPIIQSLFLVYFFYSLDQWSDTYRLIIFGLLGYQLLSFLVNFFLHFHKKLKTERLAFALLSAVWVFIYFYVKKNVHEVHFRNIDLRVFARSGVHDFYLIATALSLSIWYFSICFREIRRWMKTKKRK